MVSDNRKSIAVPDVNLTSNGNFLTPSFQKISAGKQGANGKVRY